MLRQSKFLLPALGCATVGFTTGYYTNENFEAKLWRQKYAQAQEQCSSFRSKLNALSEKMNVIAEELDKTKTKIANSCPNWTKNWDGRHENKPPKDVTRTIFFIRHGQYHDQKEEREEKLLTDLGKEQAHLAGKRLQAMGFNYSKVLISTMPRAKETGEIILQYLGDPEVVYSELIEEGNPGSRIPSSKPWSEEKYGESARRIERGFHEFVHRCDADVTEPQIDVMVCHANVIRSYVCRALQIPTECWLRFGGYNAGITGIKISRGGGCSLIFLGDIGFIPPEKVTFSTKKRSDLLSLDKKRSSFKKQKESS